jgi:hypothetical protein
MRKSLLTIGAVFLLAFVYAQKGSILVAGEIGFNSAKNPISSVGPSFSTGDAKFSNFSFSPKIGYQFNNHFTVGIESNVGFGKSTSLAQIFTPSGPTFTYVDNTTNILDIGAFLRYTKSLGGAFSIYSDFSAGMLSGKSSQSLGGPLAENKYNGYYTRLVPAVAIDLKNKLCLNFSIGGIGYDTRKPNFSGLKATSNFDFNFGKQLNFGISKNF